MAISTNSCVYMKLKEQFTNTIRQTLFQFLQTVSLFNIIIWNHKPLGSENVERVP